MLEGSKGRFIHSKNVSSTGADGIPQKWSQQDFQAHVFFENIALPVNRQSLFPLSWSLRQ